MTKHEAITLKSATDLEGMRRAGILAAEALREVTRAVRPGVAGSVLDRLAETYIRDHGGVPSFKGYRGYPASICLSINDEVVHGIPSRRILRAGDIVSIDLGVVNEEFHGDTTTTVAVDGITPSLQRLLTVTREALYVGISVLRPGRRLGDVGAAIQTLVEAAGFSIVRDFAGHGVGRHLHEEPQVPNFGTPETGIMLKAGMTLAIEPMVNMGSPEVTLDPDGWTVRTRDGKPSAQFEHTVAVTAEGATVLTAIPDGAV
jgi:methionyl aminopeptidase